MMRRHLIFACLIVVVLVRQDYKICRMNRIVIIGGGISGLAAAHRVLELNQAAQVTILEASDRFGGTIQTEHRDGFLLERGPDSFIS